MDEKKCKNLKQKLEELMACPPTKKEIPRVIKHLILEFFTSQNDDCEASVDDNQQILIDSGENSITSSALTVKNGEDNIPSCVPGSCENLNSCMSNSDGEVAEEVRTSNEIICANLNNSGVSEISSVKTYDIYSI